MRSRRAADVLVDERQAQSGALGPIGRLLDRTAVESAEDGDPLGRVDTRAGVVDPDDEVTVASRHSIGRTPPP